MARWMQPNVHHDPRAPLLRASGSTVGLRSFLRKLRKLWQLIGDVKPRRFVCDEYMKLGFDARIIIQRPKRKAVRRRIAVKAAKKR